MIVIQIEVVGKIAVAGSSTRSPRFPTLGQAAPPRFDLRVGLLLIVLLGLEFGGIAGIPRAAGEREILVADLARNGILFSPHEPTFVCLALMEGLDTDWNDVETRCAH